MKKTASMLILALVLTSFCYFHVKKVHAIEYMVNGGFETGDFTAWWNVNGVSVLTDDKHSGTYSAYIPSLNCWLYQLLDEPVLVADVGTLGCWYKGGQFNFKVSDEESHAFIFVVVPLSEDWTYYDVMPYLAEAEADYIGEIGVIGQFECETYVDDFTLTPADKYYFNFGFLDLDSEDVELYVDWALWNSTHDIGYTEGETSLYNGTYYLKTSKYGHLINTTTLGTATYGNSTIEINLNMKRHQSCTNGFIASNDTVSSITVHAETPQLLNFTMNGNTPVQLGVGVPKNATHILKDGTNMTDWTYVSSPQHIHFNVASFSNFAFVFPSTVTPVTPPIKPKNKRVEIKVRLNGEWVKGCNVTVQGGPMNRTERGLTNVFGSITFHLKAGSYEIVASYEEYRKVKPINVTDHMIVYIDFTADDIIPDDIFPDGIFPEWIAPLRGFPWIKLPEFDLTSETWWIFFLLVLLLVVYAIKKAIEKPERKWKYSYLR